MPHPRRRSALLASVIALLTVLGLGLVAPAAVAADVARSVAITGPTTVTAGQRLAISGKVSRTPKGLPVRIERRSGQTWRTVATVRTRDARGGFGWSTTAEQEGTFVYRAVAPRTRAGGRTLAAATSRPLSVKVVIQYADYDLVEYPPFDGTSSPAVQPGGITRISEGQQGSVTWDLDRRCRSGSIKVSVDQSPGGAAQFDVTADSRQIVSRAVGKGTNRFVELTDLGTPALLTVTVTGLGKPDADARLLSLVVSCDVRWARDHARA